MKVKSDMKTDDKSVHVKHKPLSELAGIQDIDFSEKKSRCNQPHQTGLDSGPWF